MSECDTAMGWPELVATINQHMWTLSMHRHMLSPGMASITSQQTAP